MRIPKLTPGRRITPEDALEMQRMFARRVPRHAMPLRTPLVGTVLLVLWQRSFSTWPGWLYGMLWTVWGVRCLVWVFEVVGLRLQKKMGVTRVISTEEWQEVFGVRSRTDVRRDDIARATEALRETAAVVKDALDSNKRGPGNPAPPSSVPPVPPIPPS